MIARVIIPLYAVGTASAVAATWITGGIVSGLTALAVAAFVGVIFLLFALIADEL